jgi:hypothetical protein
MSTGTSNHFAAPVTGKSGNAVLTTAVGLVLPFISKIFLDFTTCPFSGKMSSATSTGYGLDGPDSIPCSARYFSLLHSVRTIFGVHPATYLKGTGGSLLWG